MQNRNVVTVVKEFTFDSAHYLPDHPGKCKQFHGHTYRLQIGVSGPIQNTGMVLDFGDLKKIVNEKIIEPLDHHLLNDVKENNFPYHCPTAETMVLWIRDVLSIEFNKFPGRQLTAIRLWETPNSYAEWRAI